MPAHRERSSSVNYGGPALVTNGDYLTIRANPLENNLVLWKFEKGKRSSVTWIRNTPDAHPSLFFPAMLHTDSIITAAGLPRMSFQAGLLDVAAYFAIVRLLGPCSVGAVYKKQQQDGKGSHDDLLSCCGFLVRNPRTLARLVRCFHELLRAFSIVLRSATLNRSQSVRRCKDFRLASTGKLRRRCRKSVIFASMRAIWAGACAPSSPQSRQRGSE